MRARSLNKRALAVRIDDGDEPAAAAHLERDEAVTLGEDRVVAAEAGAGARPEARAALADDDRPRGHALAVEDLDAEHLGLGVAPVPRRSESFLVSHLLLLLRLERGQRAFALAVCVLVLERRLDLLGRPVAGLLGDVLDCHVRVTARQLRGSLRRLLLLRRGRAGALRRADRLDLDLRQLRAEAGVLAVAGLRPVLADPDLFAQRGADHLRGHLGAARGELELPVAAEHQHLRMEGLALLRRQAVHEQALALANAVLLAAQ